MAEQTFRIRYASWARWFLVAVGLGPRRTRVVVADDAVRVRFGYGFRSDVPRASIRSVRPAGPYRWWWGYGAHLVGRGRWLVNGASTGLVELDADPPAPGRVLGVPVRVRQVIVSVDDPGGLVAAVGRP